MSVRTYDPKQVVVVIGGTIMGGFADGTFVTVARENDAFAKSSGADGIVTRAKSNDRSGSLSLTLAQSSPSNDVLSVIAIADEQTSKGIVPVAIRDFSGRSTFVSAFGWIRKIPDSEFGKDVSDREWVFDLADLDSFVGGNLQAE